VFIVRCPGIGQFIVFPFTFAALTLALGPDSGFSIDICSKVVLADPGSGIGQSVFYRYVQQTDAG